MGEVEEWGRNGGRMGEVEEGRSSQIPPGSVEPSLQQAVLWPHEGHKEDGGG